MTVEGAAAIDSEIGSTVVSVGLSLTGGTEFSTTGVREDPSVWIPASRCSRLNLYSFTAR